MRQPRHAPFVALGLVSAALAAVPARFASTMPDPAQLAGAFSAWSVALYVAAAGGTFLAATSFERGDPMRWGWGCLAASYLALVPTILILDPKAEGLYRAPVRLPWLVAGAGIASGALAVGAFLVLARAWHRSGLDAASPRGRALAVAVALAIATLLAGADVRERIGPALGGDVLAVADVVTDLLDGALFVVAVPVLRAALALGGGIVAWPWLLLTASLAAWLGYDATANFAEGGTALDPRTVRVVEEVLRTLGAMFAAAAGVAQRWVIVEARER